MTSPPMTASSVLPLGIVIDVGGVVVDVDGVALSEAVQQRWSVYRAPERWAHSFAEAEAAAWRQREESSTPWLRRWSQVLDLGEDMAAEVWTLVVELDRGVPGLWSIVNERTATFLRSMRAAGLRIAALSNAAGNTGPLLDVLGLGSLFDVVLDSSIVGCEKPAAAAYRNAAARLGLEAGDCLYVGDSPNEIDGALAVGMAALLFDRLDLYRPSPDWQRTSLLTPALVGMTWRDHDAGR